MITSIINGLDLGLYAQFFPFLIVAIAIVFLMVAKIVRLFVPVAFVVTIALLVIAWLAGFGDHYAIENGSYLVFAVDNLGRLGLKLLLPAVVVVSLMILKRPSPSGKKIEALLLVLISCLGAMVTLVSHNWMLFFVGVQCLSLPLYGLLAFDVDDTWSLSSSTRYLLMSFMAMAIMLFGILLLYAACGSMDLYEQSTRMNDLMPAARGIMGLGIVFILAGLGFKASLFPFHAWAPEVYQGARFFVTGYLVVVVKSVVLLFLMRTTFLLLNIADFPIASIISFMAILSMWVGNGMMVKEVSFIRLIAFLSIGHLGALMIPVLANNQIGNEAIFLDMVAFGAAILLIFATLKSIQADSIRGFTIEDLRGQFTKHPWSSVTLTVALISLTGFPMTAGFVGKFAIFRAGIDAQLWHLLVHYLVSSLLGLAVIARIIAGMWQKSPATAVAIEESHSTTWLPGFLFCAALAIVALGVFPELWISWIKGYTSGAPHF